MSAFNLVQLAAAVVVGIVIGKAAHLIMGEESAMASSATPAAGGLRAEPSRSPAPDRSAGAADAVDPLDRAELLDPIEPKGAHAASRPRASNSARAFPRGPVAARNAPFTPERRPPCNLAAAQVVSAPPSAPRSVGGGPHREASSGVVSSGVISSAALSKSAAPFACPTSIAATLAPQLPGATPSLLAPFPGSSFPGSPLPNSPLAASPLQRSQTTDDAALVTDDWLGEQLAILARAERSIIEGDPENAARSLDEYKARFPDGLLDPQMASVRQRVEERFTAFIFP
jgi:hypothetical protein